MLLAPPQLWRCQRSAAAAAAGRCAALTIAPPPHSLNVEVLNSSRSSSFCSPLSFSGNCACRGAKQMTHHRVVSVTSPAAAAARAARNGAENHGIRIDDRTQARARLDAEFDVQVAELPPEPTDGHPLPLDHPGLPRPGDVRGLERHLVSVHVGELLLKPNLVTRLFGAQSHQPLTQPPRESQPRSGRSANGPAPRRPRPPNPHRRLEQAYRGTRGIQTAAPLQGGSRGSSPAADAETHQRLQEGDLHLHQQIVPAPLEGVLRVPDGHDPELEVPRLPIDERLALVLVVGLRVGKGSGRSESDGGAERGRSRLSADAAMVVLSGSEGCRRASAAGCVLAASKQRRAAQPAA